MPARCLARCSWVIKLCFSHLFPPVRLPFQECCGVPHYRRHQRRDVWVHGRLGHDVWRLQLEAELPLVPCSPKGDGPSQGGQDSPCQVWLPLLNHISNTFFPLRLKVTEALWTLLGGRDWCTFQANNISVVVKGQIGSTHSIKASTIQSFIEQRLGKSMPLQDIIELIELVMSMHLTVYIFLELKDWKRFQSLTT